MAILNQETQSSLSNNKNTKGGLSTNLKGGTNYNNTLVSTKGQGKVISQVNPLDSSNLAPKPGSTNQQSYIEKSFGQSLK